MPRLLGIPVDVTLPLYNRRAFTKSVWDMEVLSVRGVANLVMNYPNAQAALLGELCHILSSCSLQKLLLILSQCRLHASVSKALP